MLTDGRTDGRTDARTDEGRKVITIAHPELSSGELKKGTQGTFLQSYLKIQLLVFDKIFFKALYAYRENWSAVFVIPPPSTPPLPQPYPQHINTQTHPSSCHIFV